MMELGPSFWKGWSAQSISIHGCQKLFCAESNENCPHSNQCIVQWAPKPLVCWHWQNSTFAALTQQLGHHTLHGDFTVAWGLIPLAEETFGWLAVTHEEGT